jgi:nucleoside-diphosphate-sugar epimerase
MKILITGATGFIGRNLSNKLVEKYEVYAIVRKYSNTLVLNKNINVFRYDGNIDNLINFFQKENFDGVIHLASFFLTSHNPNDISELINSNIKFGTELLEVSKQTKVKWFINTGTFWQHFNNEKYNPVNLYAATKEAFEVIAKYYVETSDLVFTTIKLNDTFGPNDTRKKIFNLWLDCIKNNRTLDMSKGEQLIDISYIDDVVNAYEVMIQNLSVDDYKKYNLKNYIVSNKEKMSLKELAYLFEEVVGKKLNIDWGAREYREREVMIPCNKGELVPNWKQKYSLKEAMKITLKGFLNE